MQYSVANVIPSLCFCSLQLQRHHDAPPDSQWDERVAAHSMLKLSQQYFGGKFAQLSDSRVGKGGAKGDRRNNTSHKAASACHRTSHLPRAFMRTLMNTYRLQCHINCFSKEEIIAVKGNKDDTDSLGGS